jgi:hypothetical protein
MVDNNNFGNQITSENTNILTNNDANAINNSTNNQITENTEQNIQIQIINNTGDISTNIENVDVQNYNLNNEVIANYQENQTNLQ